MNADRQPTEQYEEFTPAEAKKLGAFIEPAFKPQTQGDNKALPGANKINEP